MSKLQVIWEVNDPYLGYAKHELEIFERDLLDCDSEKKVRDLAKESVRKEFSQQFSFGCEERSLDNLVSAWKQLKAEAEEKS